MKSTKNKVSPAQVFLFLLLIAFCGSGIDAAQTSESSSVAPALAPATKRAGVVPDSPSPAPLQFDGLLGRQLRNSSVGPQIFQDKSFGQGTLEASAASGSSASSAPCPLESQ